MKYSPKRSLTLLCCLTALLMCGCKGGTVSEANSDSLPAVTTGATAETVSETQPAPASTTAETESDSESASEDTTAEMPSGSPADMGTAIKSEDGKRNAQLLVDYFYGNWQCAGSDNVMEINDGRFYSPWFGVTGLFIDGSVIELDTMSNGFAILYKLDTAAPDKMQMCTLSSAVDTERWVEYTRVGEPEKTNVIQGVGRYRINQQYGIPYKTLWLLDYTDDDGTLWTTERLILNSESEDKLEFTAQLYREVPSLPDDEYISVNYTVEKNGDVWERTLAQ